MHQSGLKHKAHEYIVLTSIEQLIILLGKFSFLNRAGPIVLLNATTIQFSTNP